MKHLLLILLAAALCATASAQTIRSLGYNSTNGQIVAATNVVWTNSFNFSTSTVAAQVRTNLLLSSAWLTNTNANNFRTAIGLGVTNSPEFATVDVTFLYANAITSDYGQWFEDEGAGEILVYQPLAFGETAGQTRTNLSLGLAALTNTSNVTMIQALSGAAAPAYNGTIIFTNIQGIVVSNGIIVDIEE